MSTYFHIIQHVIGDENLFRDDGNYHFFIGKIQKILLPTSPLLAYCLLPNHLHFLIKTENKSASFQALSNLFNSYAKSYNKLFSRKGGLFIKQFERKEIFTQTDIKRTIQYIHRNPIHHGFCSFYNVYSYSSYSDIIYNRDDLVSMNAVLELYGDLEKFKYEHEKYLQ